MRRKRRAILKRLYEQKYHEAEYYKNKCRKLDMKNRLLSKLNDDITEQRNELAIKLRDLEKGLEYHVRRELR